MARKNDNNLVPLNKRPKSIQREIQEMGVEAAKKARIKTKNMQAVLSVLLGMKPNMDIVPDKIMETLAMIGVEPISIDTNDVLLAACLFVRALEDTNAQKYLDEVLGRNPALKLKREDVKLKRKELEMKRRLAEKVEQKIEDPYTHLSDDELIKMVKKIDGVCGTDNMPEKPQT